MSAIVNPPEQGQIVSVWNQRFVVDEVTKSTRRDCSFRMRYKADITAGALKLPESRIVAELLLRKVDAVGWKDAIENQNVMQARSPATARRLTKLIRGRLETMGPELWTLIRDGNGTVATHAVFAAAVKHSPLAQWRDSSSKGSSYDRLSAEGVAILRIEDYLPSLEIDQLLDVMTFLAVEKRIASSLRERVQTTADTINADDVRAIATRRQSGHWASLSVAGSSDAPRQALHAVYDALAAAADLFALRNQYKSGFDYPDAASMYRTYESELYRFDQLYRHFCDSADTAKAAGWDILKMLRTDIEAHYVNWYLTNLALAWGKFIEPLDGLLANWKIDTVLNQYSFYDRNVRPWLEEGDILGVMGRLLTENPEQFLRVMNVFSTIVPFVLAGGTIIWIALRSKKFQLATFCAQCKHDLSKVDLQAVANCPGCGVDLSQPKTVVVLPNQRRRWGLAIWGITLLLTPVVVQLGLSWLSPMGNPLQLLGNQRLIHNRLPNQVDEPWAWNELANRLNKQALSKQETDDAIQELIAYMKKTRPAGWDQPLPWQKDFIRAAVQAKMISGDVFLELCDAFYGPKPVAQSLPPIRQGKSSFQLDIKYGTPWSNESGLGVELLWDVRQVLMDGRPLTFRQTNVLPGQWLGLCDGNFEVGDHEITVEIECAYVDQSKLPGANLPASQWPSARKRWTTTISVPVTVEPLELR